MAIIKSNSGSFVCKEGQSLLSAMLENGIYATSPCGGHGICGKCKVILVEGEKQTHILSCQYYPTTDIEIIVNEKLQETTSEKIIDTDGVSSSLGVAIDIGTTTISVYLCDVANQKILTSKSMLNHQLKHGADVISRIKFCMETENGTETLKNEITKQITDIILGFKGINFENIEKIVVAGNTTMLHILFGVNPSPIAKYPFSPVFLNRKTVTAKELGIFINEKCVLTALPSLSAFVGADITAGIISSSMLNHSTSMLIDIGTNGEMALWYNKRLYTCSTAAGPAFEGYNLSCGVGCVDGGINEFDEKFNYKTINNYPPCGICGSGYIDLLTILLDKNIVSSAGYMKESFGITNNIQISPEDIRNLQLAKGAIYAGILTLCEEAGCDLSEIDIIFLSGGFGSYLKPQNAIKIGLLPKSFLKGTKALGNTSASGAIMILFDENLLQKADEIAKMAEYIELSESNEFQEKYIDSMSF